MQFFFSLKLIWGETSWGFPRENWTDSYGHSEQPTIAQSFHKMPNPKCWSGTDLQLCGAVNHLEGGSYCNGTHWGHVWTQPTSTTQEASHEMLATFLQGLQGVAQQQRKKKKKTTIFQTQDLLLEMFMAWTRWIRWADHSGLLSDIESLLKKYVALTGFAKLFMNAHIFTQDRSRESKIWHGSSCQLLSCIFVSNQIAIRTLLRINLLYLICWKIWTLKSCKTGRKCFFTFQ